MKFLIIIIILSILAFLVISLPTGSGYFIIYAALLLYLLVPILTQSKTEILRKFRYLAIWGVIFITGFIAISYKDIFLNNRIVANLVPGRAEYNQQEVIFYAASDNHFYVHALVNRHKIEFLLDTGASDIILSKKDASMLGFDLASLKYNKIYYTANGAVRAASVTLDKIIIGDMVFNNIRVSINDGDMHKSLLGMSFLRLFSSYRFESDRVTLVK
ncbi:MAG: TIGR02281 family clan AA aspartic protease [Rickettsiales bacterium]|jgi:aspartyl protease family protein|nr:TIGR02281 family clan AA aspartic protease [Rickettsiales bacterium]